MMMIEISFQEKTHTLLLGGNTEIYNCIIDAWIWVLNLRNKDRLTNSTTPLFLTTNCHIYLYVSIYYTWLS